MYNKQLSSDALQQIVRYKSDPQQKYMLSFFKREKKNRIGAWIF